MENIKAGNYNKVEKRIRTISISVSYDMGWQKRSTGRIYDSVSRHGFFIGRRTKNVISMGITKKEMQ